MKNEAWENIKGVALICILVVVSDRGLTGALIGFFGILFAGAFILLDPLWVFHNGIPGRVTLIMFTFLGFVYGKIAEL